jgi:hypothetical protein
VQRRSQRGAPESRVPRQRQRVSRCGPRVWPVNKANRSRWAAGQVGDNSPCESFPGRHRHAAAAAPGPGRDPAQHDEIRVRPAEASAAITLARSPSRSSQTVLRDGLIGTVLVGAIPCECQFRARRATRDRWIEHVRFAASAGLPSSLPFDIVASHVGSGSV